MLPYRVWLRGCRASKVRQLDRSAASASIAKDRFSPTARHVVSDVQRSGGAPCASLRAVTPLPRLQSSQRTPLIAAVAAVASWFKASSCAVSASLQRGPGRKALPTPVSIQ